ncbi:unnamed protein product [Dovyalis caffra]|uniref:Uncharacterized protein n=1 Tax=Dovyalis caffra TaxID=77055 RepID=A0AAV1RIM7_9ROSI|nr:unnamed protein product [Dovyalis caffra]
MAHDTRTILRVTREEKNFIRQNKSNPKTPKMKLANHIKRPSTRHVDSLEFHPDNAIPFLTRTRNKKNFGILETNNGNTHVSRLPTPVHTMQSVHDQEHHQEPFAETKVETKITDGKCTSLTVWRKSLLISCNGFTVINSCGDLAYRVDNYFDHPEELILMDGSGKSIFTMRRRKKLGLLVDNWLVYEGEGCATTKLSKKPIWCVRKNVNVLKTNHSVLAYVFRGSLEKRCSFVIEGSYTHRSCKVLDVSRKVLAEIKRKEAIVRGVSYGVEVFVLNVEPGFDAGFAMVKKKKGKRNSLNLFKAASIRNSERKKDGGNAGGIDPHTSRMLSERSTI